MVKIPRLRGELLFGLGPCLMALKSKRRNIYNVLIQRKLNACKKDGNLRRLISHEVEKYHQAILYTVDKEKMDCLVGKKKSHQGIILDVEPLKTKQFKENDLLHKSRLSNHPLWLFLYHIQDPMNLGAILRCSYYFGVDKVIVTSQNSCSLSPAVSKASAGAMELIPIYSVDKVVSFLQEAVGLGWTILGAIYPTRSLRMPIFSTDEYGMTKPTILLMGNEGYGLPHEVISLCTAGIAIYPVKSLSIGFDSLNVAVAAGIILNSLTKNS